MNTARMGELLAVVEANRSGVTLEYRKKGDAIGGFMSNDVAPEDAWVVGYISGIGGGEIAVCHELDDAVAAAIDWFSDD